MAKLPCIAVVDQTDADVDAEGQLVKRTNVRYYASLTNAPGISLDAKQYMRDDARSHSPERFIQSYGDIVSVVLATITSHYPQIPPEGFILCLSPVGPVRSFTLLIIQNLKQAVSSMIHLKEFLSIVMWRLFVSLIQLPKQAIIQPVRAGILEPQVVTRWQP